MAEPEIEDGTWTQRVTWHQDGIWRIVVFKSAVTSNRFRRARFVLVDGPTILVPGKDLRQVVEQRIPPGKNVCPLRINPGAGTINGLKVTLAIEN